MPGWDEASIDELLADPITRAVMAADGVHPVQLRALLHRVQRMIERYATTQGAPSSLASFAQLNSARPKTDPPRIAFSANCLADPSRLSIVQLASPFCGATGAVRG